ncbi:MAG: peptidoglycan-binding protein, partial [Alphaproteobacteria bacterium]
MNVQQQTTIQQSVLSARNAPRVNVNRVNFAVNPGAVVPSHVNIVSVSAFPTLIDVFPRFRDDSLFVVEDEIVFLDRDRRVVDVVPAGPRTHFSNRFSRGSVGSGAVATLNLSPTEIREVQQVLIERGLLTGEADGVLGSRTQEALISFQRQRGIQTTGSIDTRTVAALGLSNRIGQQSGQTTTGSQSSTVGQSQTDTPQNTTGQANGQTNAPMPQNQTTGQGSGQAQGQGQGQEQGQAQQPSAQQQP